MTKQKILRQINAEVAERCMRYVRVIDKRDGKVWVVHPDNVSQIDRFSQYIQRTAETTNTHDEPCYSTDFVAADEVKQFLLKGNRSIHIRTYNHFQQ